MNTTALLRTLIVLMSACLCAASASAQQKKAAASPTDQAVLLGQFGDWGAYRASPGGKKICFALSKPTSAATEPAGLFLGNDFHFSVRGHQLYAQILGRFLVERRLLRNGALDSSSLR